MAARRSSAFAALYCVLENDAHAVAKLPDVMSLWSTDDDALWANGLLKSSWSSFLIAGHVGVECVRTWVVRKTRCIQESFVVAR